jgi:16S rRNA (cytosine967-C5)-methyltransferase
MLGLAGNDSSLLAGFGEPRGPEPILDSEAAAQAGFVPGWLQPLLSRVVEQGEWPALLERAPLDLRVNGARTSREAMLSEFAEAVPTPLSPFGLRLPTESKVDDRPSFASGLVEVQDEGSQLIALACAPTDGEHVLDLCAGAGGKALAMAAAARGTTILATDSNRARLAQLGPRAERAEAKIETRLLNPPRELVDLADWREAADTVLVDAPCSGSGTWRRNPEGRWRLTEDRLARLTVAQERLLDIGAELVKPGGVLVYAVCSLLSREGAGQVASFLARHSSWISEALPIAGGRPDGDGRLLTPGYDHTDGFFVARLRRPC